MAAFDQLNLFPRPHASAGGRYYEHLPLLAIAAPCTLNKPIPVNRSHNLPHDCPFHAIRRIWMSGMRTLVRLSTHARLPIQDWCVVNRVADKPADDASLQYDVDITTMPVPCLPVLAGWTTPAGPPAGNDRSSCSPWTHLEGPRTGRTGTLDVLIHSCSPPPLTLLPLPTLCPFPPGYSSPVGRGTMQGWGNP